MRSRIITHEVAYRACVRRGKRGKKNRKRSSKPWLQAVRTVAARRPITSVQNVTTFVLNYILHSKSTVDQAHS